MAQEDDKIVMLDETEQQDERDEAARKGAPAETKKAEERDESADADGDDEHGDERIADADRSEEEREEIRAARREKRRRIKQYRDRSMAELNELRQQNELLSQRLAAVEGRTVSNEAAQVEQYIRTANEDLRAIEDVLAKAIAEQDGDAFAKATRLRDDARDRLKRGDDYRAMLARQAQAGPDEVDHRQPHPQQRQQAPKIDPRVLSNAKKWAEGKDWYDPSGQNEESAIVLAIDRRLVAEGYDPRDSEYWEELDDRARKRMPEVYGESRKQETRRNSGGPPVAGARGGSSSTPSGGNVVRVSAERKTAMQEAGLWDDPVKRERALRAYQKFDKENGR